MSSSGLVVRVVTTDNLDDYIDSADIHPAYQHLNLAHRADYLRAYFMHHFGGAYTDVKPISDSWIPTIEELNSSNSYWAAGYREISRHGVGNLHQSAIRLNGSFSDRVSSYTRWRWLQVNYRRVIGNGAFVFKPGTELTRRWWCEVNRRLDTLQKDLEKHPAIYPKERGGHVYDGKFSMYPVPWSYILGDIMQPLVLKYSSRVLKNMSPPDFLNYQ